jgi:mannose-6-phosphate isomerase-like protein (cupin superfamily)
MVIWAPAGVPHGVTNRGGIRLVLLVGIAPAPGG